MASANAHAVDRHSDREGQVSRHDEQRHHHRGERTYGRIALQSLDSVAGFRFEDGPIRITVHYSYSDERSERPQPDTCLMRAPTACETSHQSFMPRGEKVRIAVTQNGRTRHATYKLDHSLQTRRDDIVVER